MRVVAQRVTRARVQVDGQTVGKIDRGLLLLVGAGVGDSDSHARWLAEKCAQLRIFDDERGRFDRSLLDIGGSALVVSQFTLYGDCRKGRRPSFTAAMDPDAARPLVDVFVESLRGLGVHVETGRFGAAMAVELTNDGPVTVWLEHPE
jgi:D-tyrosyl-tRNA(Tyr) deacylase